jgi:hypothetical protein
MNFGAGLPKIVTGLGALWLVAGFAPSSAGSAEGAVAPPHQDWTVEQLVARLKEQRQPAVSFEEKTYSSLLTEPLSSKGVLRFSPPATLEKEILEPYRERYLIDGDRIVFESPKKGIKKSIALDDYPALRSLVEAFRASVTGDAARLTQYYETTIGGDRRRWTLLLRPRESEGRRMVDYILMTGTDGRIETVAIRAPDGDRSVMTLRQSPLP